MTGYGPKSQRGTKGDKVMAEKEKKKRKQFSIDGTWFMVEDAYSWNICKYDKKGHAENVTYHATIEQAVAFYLENRRSEASLRADTERLEELLNILLAENKRLAETLGGRFKAIVENSYRENR